MKKSWEKRGMDRYAPTSIQMIFDPFNLYFKPGFHVNAWDGGKVRAYGTREGDSDMISWLKTRQEAQLRVTLPCLFPLELIFTPCKSHYF